MFGFLGTTIILFSLLIGGILIYVFERKLLFSIITGLCVIVGAALVVLHFNTAEGERDLKSFNSNIGGGIERRVEVYDQQGNLIKTYEGKFDVETNEYGNKVLFDLNGKRTIIYNATVIVQEK